MEKLYDRDFYQWAQETAAALRAGRIAEVDIESIAEEIESMANRDLRELISRLRRILEHKLKLAYLPTWVVERNRRLWTTSVIKQQTAIQSLLQQSPSLRRRVPDLICSDAYTQAVRLVSESFDLVDLPSECPWTIEEILNW